MSRRRTSKRGRKPKSPIPKPNLESEIPHKPEQCPGCHMVITEENARLVRFQKDGRDTLQLTCYGCGCVNQWSRPPEMESLA